MIKYQINLFTYDPLPKISKIDINKETKNFIWVSGEQRSKKHQPVFDTYAEAKSALIEAAAKRVDEANRIFRKSINNLQRIYDL